MPALQFGETAAVGYDQAVGHMTRQIIPDLLSGGRITLGQHVLDIATGTGLAAEAAATMVGAAGRITAADISQSMLDQARQRLGTAQNISLAVEDGQSLTFADESFDAVICNMGLMYFPDASRGLREFRRVLRAGGHVAASVYAAPGRSMLGGLHLSIGRHIAPKAAEYWRFYSLGNERYLRTLFEVAGFADIEIRSKKLHLTFPSFDAYFGGVETGAGSAGQDYMALGEEARSLVREEVRKYVQDVGGPIQIEAEIRLASGLRTS
jgi:ubiquinone/menaquinone biosynthesis C-methylase UbiE